MDLLCHSARAKPDAGRARDAVRGTANESVGTSLLKGSPGVLNGSGRIARSMAAVVTHRHPLAAVPPNFAGATLVLVATANCQTVRRRERSCVHLANAHCTIPDAALYRCRPQFASRGMTPWSATARLGCIGAPFSTFDAQVTGCHLPELPAARRACRACQACLPVPGVWARIYVDPSHIRGPHLFVSLPQRFLET